jgi:hypothetical protein
MRATTHSIVQKVKLNLDFAHLLPQDVLFVHCCNWAESIQWATWAQPQSADEVTEKAAPDGKHDTLRSYLDLCRSREAYKRATVLKQAEQKM